MFHVYYFFFINEADCALHNQLRCLRGSCLNTEVTNELENLCTVLSKSLLSKMLCTLC